MAALLKLFGFGKTSTSSTHSQEPPKASKWNNKAVTIAGRDGFDSPASLIFKKQQEQEKKPSIKENRTYSSSSSDSDDFEKMGFPNPNTLGSSAEASDPDLEMILRPKNSHEDFTCLPDDFDIVHYQRRSSKTSSSSLTPEEPRKKSPDLPIAKRSTPEPKPFTGNEDLDSSAIRFPASMTLGLAPAASTFSDLNHEAAFMIFPMDDV
jgi:hypothetical protein